MVSLEDRPRRSLDIWFYPREVENELKDGISGLPAKAIREALAVAWEYTRSVIPVYTNWQRYIAFFRTIFVSVIAEFSGALFDVIASDTLLGHDMNELYDVLWAGAPVRDAMAREHRTFLPITTEETSNRRDSELFRRYVDALAESPTTWFRIRDADALARFSALECNDTADVRFTEDQWQIVGEVACTLYDAVAFHKHRAEGETNSTFAYVSPDLRQEAFRRAREVLWAMDVAWARHPDRLPVLNFLRAFGGPIHLMIRRYRFVEDGLVIGIAETEDVVKQTRQNFKLWNRVESTDGCKADDASYLETIRRGDMLLFAGLKELLQKQDKDRERCRQCQYRMSYGARRLEQFGGGELCDELQGGWRLHIESLPRRAAAAFPELRETQLRLANG
jgi:hypothetical protein